MTTQPAARTPEWVVQNANATSDPEVLNYLAGQLRVMQYEMSRETYTATWKVLFKRGDAIGHPYDRKTKRFPVLKK